MAVQTQFQIRRGTAALWTATNPTLAAGELGYETDTGNFKIGTGAATWTSLGYAAITTTGTATLTNKTLTSPTINGAALSGTITGSPTFSGTPTFSAGTTLNAPIITYTINAQTTSYTPVLSDAAAIVTLSNASANTFSIPTNGVVAYPIGASLTIIQTGAGQTTIQAVTPGTTTIASTGATSTAPKLRAQYSTATVIKVATDTWYVVGDIV